MPAPNPATSNPPFPSPTPPSPITRWLHRRREGSRPPRRRSHPSRRSPGGHLPPPRRPEDLVRAYASCFTFRRVVSGRRFLRRYRSLHPPPVLGFLAVASDGPSASGDLHSTLRFHPAEPPHRSAPAACHTWF
ncbi:hypothetical protein HU200_061077 [Digitaria exilis]|uniref:Uncharacterized protein n=1 Tax=Digitaria exilis TaxID=1010633 RepID=A0A835A5D3_9POAL|nr:hypothetical protein HU200_061077 [Digitaria exilis]